jgi:hypothetical protein
MTAVDKTFLRLMKGGSSGRGSGTARTTVGPLQRCQAGGFSVVSIPAIWKNYVSSL